MYHKSSTGYPHYELPELIAELDTEYYHNIEALCHSIGSRLELLMELDIHQSVSLYAGLCAELIREVERYLQVREQVLIPYYRDLTRKEAEGHDCRTCSGKCSINHTANLITLKEAHDSIRAALTRLQQVTIPLYMGEHKGVFRLLRNEMMLLDAALEEVLDLEATSLIPRITVAQTKIHA